MEDSINHCNSLRRNNLVKNSIKKNRKLLFQIKTFILNIYTENIIINKMTPFFKNLYFLFKFIFFWGRIN